MDLINKIPIDFYTFILVALFSLIIGLEQRRHHINEKIEHLFGTDRTFTFIGILGFILYVISKKTMLPFLAGGLALSLFLGISYYNKIKIHKKFGLTSTIIALITYSLAPLIYLEPSWLVMSIIVTILVVVEIKEDLFNFTKRFDRNEFTIFAKFIIIAGIILPLLSDKPISASINISPYKFCLAIVAISGISYFSYILKKFVFPNSGLVLTAILGGLYSSTVTTVILAKKSKTENSSEKVAGGIMLATGVMYVRLFLLAWIFNRAVAAKLIIPFLLLILLSVGIAFFLIKSFNKTNSNMVIVADRNPLEFKTALIFGVLFAFFAVLTQYVIANFGKEGIDFLSLIVGVTDIDPYILNLFQNVNSSISVSLIVTSTIIAAASNNFVKMIYALVLGNKGIKKQVVLGFSILITVSFIVAFI
ncbi:hypothetical protein BMS3Abin04_00247 [bacterium BMS3Abin04]|nr:hypothetical protein BMS3Abin04_00247 [bacterium BMS3Abin04]